MKAKQNAHIDTGICNKNIISSWMSFQDYHTFQGPNLSGAGVSKSSKVGESPSCYY